MENILRERFFWASFYIPTIFLSTFLKNPNRSCFNFYKLEFQLFLPHISHSSRSTDSAALSKHTTFLIERVVTQRGSGSPMSEPAAKSIPRWGYSPGHASSHYYLVVFPQLNLKQVASKSVLRKPAISKTIALLKPTYQIISHLSVIILYSSGVLHPIYNKS